VGLKSGGGLWERDPWPRKEARSCVSVRRSFCLQRKRKDAFIEKSYAKRAAAKGVGWGGPGMLWLMVEIGRQVQKVGVGVRGGALGGEKGRRRGKGLGGTAGRLSWAGWCRKRASAIPWSLGSEKVFPGGEKGGAWLGGGSCKE